MSDDEFFLDKLLSERVNREIEKVDDMYEFGSDLFMENQERREPKPRGRPKGIRESTVRKVKSNTLGLIIEHIDLAFSRLQSLEEIIKKTGPKEYSLLSKKKKLLGKFTNKKAAMKREKEIQFFKNNK